MDSGGSHGPSQRSEQTVGDMIDRVLPEEERELLRLYFGIGRRRHSMDELIALFDSEHKVNILLQSAMERLRYSDEILTIYKYLHDS